MQIHEDTTANSRPDRITTTFLAVVGVAYIGLAAWCAALPGQTANSVGFTLEAGSGQSEYLVVYGGLQLAFGLVFLWPLVQADALPFALRFSVIVHGCIVLFRTISFTLYSGIQSTTFALAAVEWTILLASIWRLAAQR